MAKIQVLSEHLTNMIAAGEVVERPAGIVKECVENSIDAGAKVIDIEAFQGGIERLVITDDGSGMDPQDAHMAFMRHATSKLSSEEGLFNIQTMGFRGEALPSIASVAHVRLETNDGNQGTMIEYDYGQLVNEESGHFPKGTSIAISGLFLKTPARFKHLKSVSYEFSIIADLVNKMALSHPKIRFTLSHDGRIVFQTSGNGSLQEILYQMYGREVAKEAIEFHGQNDDFKIAGYAVQPKINRATKYFMFITMNSRLIRSIPIQKAILDAYGSYLPSQRFPIVVLDIQTDAQLVDVNVHPAKSEVRFRDESAVFSAVLHAVQSALTTPLEASLGGAPADDSRPTEVPQGSLLPPRPRGFWGTVDHAPIMSDRFARSAAPDEEVWEVRQPEPQPDSSEPAEAAPLPFHSGLAEAPAAFGDSALPPLAETPVPPPSRPVRTVPQTASVAPPPVRKAAAETPAPPLEGGAMPLRIGEFCYLGQVADTYLVVRDREGALLLIDQHAAHERVLYARLRHGAFSGTGQCLALPLELALHPAEQERACALQETLAHMGFEVELSQGSLLARSIPPSLNRAEARDFLREALAGRKDDLAAMFISLSCKGAIKAGQRLAPDEAAGLLQQWLETPERDYCPHGRPAVLRWDAGALERLFKRKQ